MHYVLNGAAVLLLGYSYFIGYWCIFNKLLMHLLFWYLNSKCFQGVTYPACHGIMRHWAPPLERSRLATLAFSGCYAGLMFGMPISGELIKRIGPRAPFVFYGIVGLIWYMSWLWLVFEKPRFHPCIDPKELAYIENSLGEHSQVQTIPTITNAPWKAFFTSMPCYAIFVANFCRSWNFYLLVLFQASYFKDVYQADIEEVSTKFFFSKHITNIRKIAASLLKLGV